MQEIRRQASEYASLWSDGRIVDAFGVRTATVGASSRMANSNYLAVGITGAKDRAGNVLSWNLSPEARKRCYARFLEGSDLLPDPAQLRVRALTKVFGRLADNI